MAKVQLGTDINHIGDDNVIPKIELAWLHIVSSIHAWSRPSDREGSKVEGGSGRYGFFSVIALYNVLIVNT